MSVLGERLPWRTLWGTGKGKMHTRKFFFFDERVRALNYLARLPHRHAATARLRYGLCRGSVY